MTSINSYNFTSFKNSAKNATKPGINRNRVNIYYYNDTHGNSDQIMGVLYGAKNFKNKNKDTVNFVLSAGDNCSGADVNKNSFIFELMKHIATVDASAIGNHEIDGGTKGFCEANNNKNLNFIASNIKIDNSNPMNKYIKRSLIKERNGVKYGFVGAMPLDFKLCTKKAVQGDIDIMTFDESIKAIQNEIDKIKAQGVNKIILLSHSGYEQDKQYASNLDGVDIIVGGHTHSVVQGANHDENIVQSKSGEPVLIVQAGENGKYFGIINAEFDDNGILKSLNNKLIESPYRKKSPIIELIKSKHLGESPKIGNITKIDPMPKNRRIAPCAWSNLLADAMKTELNTDIAIVNSANTRKVPQEGCLTQRDVSESTPMKNKLFKTKVTQKQLVEALKNSAKMTFSSDEGTPGILIPSGFTYKINDKGELLELNMLDKNGNKNPVDINNPSHNIVYSAVYDCFVAQKDGEYPELYPKFNIEELQYDKDKTGIDYISKMSANDKLSIVDDKRVEILKTSQSQPLYNNNRNFLNLTSPKVS